MSFTLKQFEIGPMQNFCYLIGDNDSRNAFIVDPAWAPQKIKETASKLDFHVKGFLVTHAHYDHVNAIDILLKDFDVPVYANKAELGYAKSGATIVGDLGTTVKPVEGGATLELGQTPIRFLHTPGHTPGSQCIQVGDHLITGDTLFIGGCGRSDLPGGDPAVLYQSLRKIAELPGHLEVCPGHDYGLLPRRNLREELGDNPYLRIKDKNLFVQSVNQ